MCRAIILALVASFFLLKHCSRTEERRPDKENPVTTLIRYYESEDIKFPYVALAQSVHETGWFSSKIYNENNNRFGMKYNRRGYANSTNRGHAAYASDILSLKDYSAWQKRVLKLRPDVDTEEEYIQVLDNLPFCDGCRYAEDLEYTNKIREYIRLLKKLESE